MGSSGAFAFGGVRSLVGHWDRTAFRMTKNTKQNGASRDLRIGARVRHARILAGIRMRELAESIGCAESSISKIESGRVIPSLPMLQRIVEALGRDFAWFFGSNPDNWIVQRANERMIVPGDPVRDGKGISYERMVSFEQGNILEANIHIVAPGGGRQDRVTHPGETLGFVLEGQIELTIEEASYLLSAGDSFSFRNRLTSIYRNPGSSTARMLWVNTPQ
jgi:transcriptional regulator with XRE-family HTH domain